ncbi:MAG: hypothetical protein PHC75_08830, partial [Burkholderiales bacterium]|nr:hypothetical protein [Burkholderiales bacterium]
DKNNLIAKNIGDATIKISLHDGISVTKKVHVDNALIKSIKVIGVPSVMSLGDTATLAVMAKYSDGEELEVANKSAITWEASPSDIISITNGVLKPLKIGVGKVVAKYDGFTDTNSVNVDVAKVVKLEATPNKIELWAAGETFAPSVKAIFSDNSSRIIQSRDLNCSTIGGKDARVYSECGVYLKDSGDSTTLHIVYDGVSTDVPVTSYQSLPPIKSLDLDLPSQLVIGSVTSYKVILHSTNGRDYDVTNNMKPISSDSSKLEIVAGNKVSAKKDGDVQLSITYDGKKYVDKYVQILKGKIVSTEIRLIDSKGDVANKDYLMPHKEYTIQILSCKTENGAILPAVDCNTGFSVVSGSVNLDKMKLVPYLAGEVKLRENTSGTEHLFRTAPIRNPEYETNAGFGAEKFTKVVLSDAKAGSGYNIVCNHQFGWIDEELAKEGRYGVLRLDADASNDFCHSGGGAHWINFYFHQTNRPIKLRYQINEDTLCSTRNGIWHKNDRFFAAPFENNPDYGGWQISDCEYTNGNKNVQYNVWHNNDAVRVRYTPGP